MRNLVNPQSSFSATTFTVERGLVDIRIFTFLLLSVLFLFSSCQKEALDSFDDIKEEQEFEETNDFTQNDDQPSIHICMAEVEESSNKASPRGVATRSKLWPTGKTLRVKFLNGASKTQGKVIVYAKQWENYANVKFDFVKSGDAEIRVSFYSSGKASGHWSYIGTDSEKYSKNIDTGDNILSTTGPSMNLQLNNYSNPAVIRRVVLHEFGHALGLKHEHQNPENGIQWDKEVVYDYYEEEVGWSRDRVDHNIFDKLSTSQHIFCDYDPKSIMHYPVPNEFTLDDYEVDWNTTLSGEDKRFIGQIYPFKGEREDYCCPSTLPRSRPQTFAVGDVNGDQKADFVVVYETYNKKAGIWLRLSNGKSFQVSNDPQVMAGFSTNQRWLAGDFNGDNRTDLVNVYGYEGKARAWLHLSTGNGFEYNSGFQKFSGYWKEQKWIVGDFNGDGKDDLVNVYASKGEARAWLHFSTGNDFEYTSGFSKWVSINIATKRANMMKKLINRLLNLPHCIH